MATLNEIVLQDIRSKMQMVETDEKKAREEFLKRSERIIAAELAGDKRKLVQSKRRFAELDRLITSVYEDKVIGRIPEDICINLLEKYQAEKTVLSDDVADLERKMSAAKKNESDVDEFICRLKAYMKVPELTREMCMELIEFLTVDKCPGRYSKQPRKIHIYYKLIDKIPPPERKYVDNSTSDDF